MADSYQLSAVSRELKADSELISGSHALRGNRFGPRCGP